MGKIILEDIEVYAFHGVLPEESKTGNKFLVSLELQADLHTASKSDALEDTFNYQIAYDIVKEETKINSQLLEHLAGRIVVRVLNASEKIHAVKVKVSKMNPPFGGSVKAVSVELNEVRKK